MIGHHIGFGKDLDNISTYTLQKIWNSKRRTFYYSTLLSRVQITLKNQYKYITVFGLQKTGLTGLNLQRSHLTENVSKL